MLRTLSVLSDGEAGLNWLLTDNDVLNRATTELLTSSVLRNSLLLSPTNWEMMD